MKTTICIQCCNEQLHTAYIAKHHSYLNGVSTTTDITKAHEFCNSYYATKFINELYTEPSLEHCSKFEIIEVQMPDIDFTLPTLIKNSDYKTKTIKSWKPKENING